MIVGNTVSYAITDGGPLDEDGALNGAIVDPVVVAAPTAAPPQSVSNIPVNQPLALLLASGLIGWIIVRFQRRRASGGSVAPGKP